MGMRPEGFLDESRLHAVQRLLLAAGRKRPASGHLRGKNPGREIRHEAFSLKGFFLNDFSLKSYFLKGFCLKALP
jgi:hypothetical protein